MIYDSNVSDTVRLPDSVTNGLYHLCLPKPIPDFRYKKTVFRSKKSKN